MNPRKRLLLFATKLGYQTRSFNAAAEKLGVELAFVTDRCGRMDDPWNDHALATHFEARKLRRVPSWKRSEDFVSTASWP